MKRVHNGWAALALAAAGVVLGFFLAASTLSLGRPEVRTDPTPALPAVAQPRPLEGPRFDRLTPEEQRRIRIFREASRSVCFISLTQRVRTSYFSRNV